MALEYLQMEDPIRDQKFKFYMLVEMSGNMEDDQMTDKMIELFEKLEGHYDEGIICDNETQIEKMWKIRESISLATAQYGLVITSYPYLFLYLIQYL